ncbi:leucine-rich repeat-containing protein 20 isoform X5 [Chelonia mydas]|uniref:leucine-rich repeat-containing protein 20 isoform X5 n=1 Tax=Chelonia mydas TaxID=8469 RepID=UPI001CA8676C|nr:leucine-rich repeat-containing protein 20 isoform X5 [Chelonia mydas]
MRFPRSPSPIKTASCVTLIACTLLHLYSLPPVNCMHISSQPVARTPEWLPAARRLFPLWKCFPGGTGCGACMEKKMGEAVARVARKVNETVENGADSLELNLEGNYLHRLPEEMRTLLHLKVINLSRNKFRHFPEQLTTLKALETINLEENEITDVPVEKLSSMESLQSVNLKSNPLNEEVRVIARPLIKFDLLVSPKGAHAAPPQA